MRHFAVLVALCFVTGCAAGSARGAAQARDRADRDPKFLLARGKEFAEVGDSIRAEQYLAASLAAGGNEAETVPLLLRVCVASRHYRLATEYAEQSLARHPHDARLRFLTGALYVSIGESGRARGHLEQTARELPDDAEVQFSVAVFFRDELTDRVSADPYFRDYLRLAPRGEHADEARASMMEDVR